MKKYNKQTIKSAYQTCPIAEKLISSIEVPLKRYSPILNNYIFIVEEDYVILLFPSNDLNRLNNKFKEIIIEDIEANIKNSGLKLKESKNLIFDKYRVGFLAHSFVISA